MNETIPNQPSQSGAAESAPHTHAGEQGDVVLYCANHPTVETSLRCARCEKPICARCAVSTPTGYKCKECVRGQQKVFSTTKWYDYPLTFVISAVISGIASFLIGRFLGGFFIFFLFLIAPAVGVGIAEAVRAAVSRRRSLRLWQVMVAGIILGALPMLLLNLAVLNLWGLAGQGIFLVMATSSAVARLRGINVRR